MKNIITKGLVFIIFSCFFIQCKKDSSSSSSITQFKKVYITWGDTTGKYNQVELPPNNVWDTIPILTISELQNLSGHKMLQSNLAASHEIPNRNLPKVVSQSGGTCQSVATSYSLAIQYSFVEGDSCAAYEYLDVYNRTGRSEYVDVIIDDIMRRGLRKTGESPDQAPFHRFNDYYQIYNIVSEEDILSAIITYLGNFDEPSFEWDKTIQSTELIKQTLTKNVPVLFGMNVGERFKKGGYYRQAADGRLIYYGYDPDKDTSRHILTIVGYDDAINAFKVINSWGSGWGQGGYIWIDYNTFWIALMRNSSGRSCIFVPTVDTKEAVKNFLTGGSSRNWKWDPAYPFITCCNQDQQLDDILTFYAQGGCLYDNGPDFICPNDSCGLQGGQSTSSWQLVQNASGKCNLTLGSGSNATTTELSRINTNSITLSVPLSPYWWWSTRIHMVSSN